MKSDRHTLIHTRPRLYSQIHATTLRLPDELDDLDALRQELGRQQLRFRRIPDRPLDWTRCDACRTISHLGGSGRCLPCRRQVAEWKAYLGPALAAIRRGEVRHTRVLRRNAGDNRLVRGFYEDFFARLGGALETPGVNQTLQVEQLAVGTKYVDPGFNGEQLGNEIYRAEPGEKWDNGISTFSTTVWLKKSQANPTGNTTATAGTANTITLDDATGFIVGGRCLVECPGAEYTFTVSAIDGNTLTCVAIRGGTLTSPAGAGAFPEGDTPTAGNRVLSLHSEAACFIGGTASSTPNSGKMMNWRPLEEPKTEDDSMLYDYILACESVD